MTSGLATLLRERLRGQVLEREPLSRHTSLKVGGAADIFAVPDDRDDLQVLMTLLAGQTTPYLVIGGGYNLLVRDGGFRGAVISLARLMALEQLPGNRADVEAGVTNRQLVNFCRERGLSGAEFLAGIPGSMGGALAMNAGAHGGAILELVVSLTTLREGTVVTTERSELRYGYRHLELASGEIILGARLQLATGDPAALAERIDSYLAHRRQHQNVGHPNAGSFFKNPTGEQAWRLIDRAGLRGYRVGGAQVSEVHTNFLVNAGGATAADFLELARVIKERVKEQCGVELEEEVRIVGEDGE
ncbi:UDP-N-acetylmuramate dehydrogenase [Geomobilimonas luticola]|uniref:UDP-N-acetylenolpyruvoylglucosamine reductase n=1 Tax=Geomobilimonas luticola TaxID=1114878 RepID=A0ABS5SD68_9BACT|nr:UDP-N-acetylmuramate dehydrogenase [Geomobilimonas luticola]MBT0653313.1 UDP-N-acetylmuramate dehydrogenase [Geomobilimonas luticola]